MGAMCQNLASLDRGKKKQSHGGARRSVGRRDNRRSGSEGEGCVCARMGGRERLSQRRAHGPLCGFAALLHTGVLFGVPDSASAQVRGSGGPTSQIQLVILRGMFEAMLCGNAATYVYPAVVLQSRCRCE